MTTNFCNFLPLSNQHYVVSFEKLDKAHESVGLFNHLLLYVEFLQVGIELIAIKYFGVFIHNVSQSNVTIIIRSLLQFDDMQLTLNFVTTD